MQHSIRSAHRHDAAWLGMVVAVTLGLAATVSASGPAAQVPAPYQLFVRTDCELESSYSVERNATTVQLALTPPGPGDMPSGVSLILTASHSGRQPAGPGGDISVLVLPSATGNPNVERGLELKFRLERRGEDPIALDYFGRNWGEYGYIPAGGEITRVVFSMSVADLKALLLASKVAGRAMNADFVLTDRHLAALRLFARAIGVSIPSDKGPLR